MGRDLASRFTEAQAVFAQADDILGFALSRIAWEGPEELLNDTINTQPALLVHSVAAWQVLRMLQPELRPRFAAGHSMGELSALVAAGAVDFPDALRLVRRRGELMKMAGEHSPGGMAAILGLDIPTLDQICNQASTPEEPVQVANDNCPGQVVISGARPALERALELARSAGARRAVALAVSIPAHSVLMGHAQDAFNQAVDQTPLHPANIPIIGNVSAAPMQSVAEIKADLKAQLNSRVRWTESIQWMAAQGADTFLEIGSGNVLGGLIRRIDKQLTSLSLGAPADFEQLSSS